MTESVGPFLSLRHRYYFALFACVFILSLIACGSGGSGSGGSKSPPVVSASDLETVITFPPDGSATGGVNSLIVSGIVNALGDSNLSADDIASFSVNGVEVEVDYDNGRWQARIPLVPEDNVKISTELAVKDGSSNQAEIVVNNLPVRPDYRLIEATSDGEEAIVSSGSDLRKVDLASGKETFLVHEFGDGFWAHLGIRSASDQNESYFLRRSAQATYDASKFDAGSHEWSSIGALPIGPYIWNEYLDFDLDEVMGRLILSFHSISEDQNFDSCDLREVSIASGVVSTFVKTDSLIVSPNQQLEPFCPGAVVVDASSNQVIVAARYDIDPEINQIVQTDQLGIYGYDLGTGLVRIVSGSEMGSGPPLSSPEWLFMGDQIGHVLAVDQENILKVDITTGDREMVLDDPELPSSISDMDYDPVHQRLLIARENTQILSLSLTDGSLEQLLSTYPVVGTGPSLDPSTPGVIAENDQVLYNIDARNNQLLSMSISGLRREVVVAPIVPGEDWLPFRVTSITQDELLRMLYFSSDHTIYEIDLSSGEVETLAPDEDNPVLHLNEVSGLSVDSENRILYVSAKTSDDPRKGIVSIDLRVGEWKILSAGIPGPANDLVANLFDAENDRLLAVTAAGDIVSIDALTGERSEVARNSGLPNGENLGVPKSIVFDSVPGSLLLGYTQGVVSVDISSGRRTIVSNKIRNISVDRADGVIYGAYSVSEVVAVDRYSGEIATVSRVEY